MFGNLLGTLQKFKQDENRVKDREQKKRDIEKKIDEKTEKEKEEAKRTKNELFSEKKKQEHEIKILQVIFKTGLTENRVSKTEPINRLLTLFSGSKGSMWTVWNVGKKQKTWNAIYQNNNSTVYFLYA